MDIFKNHIVEILASHIDMDREELSTKIEVPPDSKMGDYGLPCFFLAKKLRKAPPLIAEEIVAKIRSAGGISSEYISDVNALRGYVNFRINRGELAKVTLSSINEHGDNYGASKMGQGKTVVLDYSSPNIAKRFSIAHIRTTVIGHALYKIHSFLGYDCVGINHLGDWGTQFGKLIAAYKRWGNEDELKTDPLTKLQELYVKFNKEAEKDSSLENEGRFWFKKLEEGEEEAHRLWQWFKDISIEEFMRIYRMMGIDFQEFTGESFYNDKIDRTIEKLKSRGLVKESRGALIVDLEEYDMPPCLLKKGDGATLYATRDIAAAIYRHEKYNFEKLIYVVGAPQSLHFQQVFKVLELAGYEWVKNCVHVPFGIIKFEEGTMSTRKGNVIFLEDVLKRSVELTASIINEKNPELANKDEVARDVGIGAIIFNDLKNGRMKDINFNWGEVLNFDGETGPYVQYTHARACSVLKKAGEIDLGNVNYSRLQEDEAVALLKGLYNFNTVIVDAANAYEPSIIARHIINLAESFNKFYHSHRILTDDSELTNARLALVDGVRQVLRNGLGLLGIKAPEEM